MNTGVPKPRQHTDGRVARGERTREAIVAAHTALLVEGVLKPTGQAIADRAEVSVRTLWANFKDLEALLEATTAYWLDADLELARPIDPALPLPERIEKFCDQRADRLEHLAPAARSAALGEPFSPALQASRRAHVVRIEGDIAAVFGAELDASDDRDELARSLFVVVSWPTWTTLRGDFGLDVGQAMCTMRHQMSLLLRR